MSRSERLSEKELLERALRLVSDHVGELGGASASAAVRVLRTAADRAGEAKGVQRRARVLVLFADLAGFTPFSEATDAEEVNHFVGGLWDCIDHLVHARGGRVLQHFGDAVLAVWGDECAREDDAERALACAKEILESVPRHIAARLLEPGKTAPPGMRIGLHAGPAFTGPIGSLGEYAALGDTVNAASRLQTAARPGEAVFSEAVLRLLRSPPGYRELLPLTLKGKSEAIRAFALEPRGEAVAEGERKWQALRRGRGGASASAMVGREKELQKLRDLFSGLVSTGKSRSAAISGEAGIGKSRLLAEFLAGLPAGTRILMATARESSRNSPHSFLRALVGGEAGILDSDGEEAAATKLACHAESIGLGTESSLQLARLLGYVANPLEFPMEDGSDVLAAYLSARTRGATLVLALEDLGWADEASRSVIDAALLRLGNEPVMAIRVSRESPEKASADEILELGRLSALEAEALAVNLLSGFSPIPEELLRFILSRAEGNPYFIGECVGFLCDRGAVDRSASPWRFDRTKLPRNGIPPALGDLLQARLDALESADRRLLETASVFGRVFWLSALASRPLRGKGGAPAGPRRRLATLAERGLVLRHEASTVAGTEEWSFAHNLLRDVAFDRILLADRPELHERAARWLLDHLGQSAGREAAVIADHFAQAGRSTDAAGLFVAAGDLAERAGDLSAATRLYARAIETKGLKDPVESRIRKNLARLSGEGASDIIL